MGAGREQPGTSYGYSGEGFEYLAKFVEKKTGEDFSALVREHLFAPNGIENAAYAIDPGLFKQMMETRNEAGKCSGHYCRPNGWCRKPGSYSAADDLVISVEDYAKFLISVMNGGGYSKQLEAQAYFYTQSKDGLIIFINGPNRQSLKAMPAALQAIDADSPMSNLYQRWHQKSLSSQ